MTFSAELPGHQLVAALEDFLATPLDAALAGADGAAAAQRNVLELFHSVAEDVPAYRAFLSQHGIDPAQSMILQASMRGSR